MSYYESCFDEDSEGDEELTECPECGKAIQYDGDECTYCAEREQGLA